MDVPAELVYVARRLSGFRREWRKIYPENSRTGNPNEWSEFVLPKDCFCDLKSFRVMGDLIGIKSDPSATVSLPRHSESYIGQTEVLINNIMVDQIQNANHLFHMRRPFEAADGSDNRGVLQLDTKYTGAENIDNTTLASVDVPLQELNAITTIPVSTPGAYFPLTQNCMAWYDFSARNDLGRDVSGHGRHGMPLDGPTWSASRGNSISFQGNTPGATSQTGGLVRRIDLSAHVALYRNMTAITVSGWVRTLSTNSLTGGIFNISDNRASTTDFFIGGASASTLGFWCRPNNNNAYIVSSSVACNDGRWHHWAISAGPAGNYLIVDGVLATTYTAGNAADTRGPWNIFVTNVIIGANQRSNPWVERGMDVEMADITVWNYQLSGNEIEELFRDRYGSDVITILGDDNAVGQVVARPGIDNDLTPLNDRVLQFGADTNLSRIIMPLGSGVRAYYDFPDAPNLTRDVSGNGRIAVNNASSASTERGGSITLNGTSNRMDIWNAEYADLNDVTVSCWARFTHTNTRCIFSFSRNQSAAQDWQIFSTGTFLSATVRINGQNIIQILTNTAFNDNQWHHCVLTTGRRGNSFWVDGVLQTRYIFGDASNTTTVRDILPQVSTIGAARTTGYTSFWLGGISDVLISNEQFSTADVLRLYNDDYGHDVYAFIGQSNSVGWTTQETGVDDVYTAVGRVDQYLMDTNVNLDGTLISPATAIAPATNPINFSSVLNSTRPVNSTGLWRTMFESIQSNLVPRRRRILMLPLAVGGTGFSDWNWNVGDTQYNTTVNVINHVMQLNRLNVIRGVIQVLGEWDSNDQNATFPQDMLAMYRGFLNDIPALDHNVPFIAAGIKGSAAGSTWVTNINNYLSNFTTGALNYSYVDVSDLTLRDAYHYTAASYRTLGIRVAIALTGRHAAISNNATANPNTVTGVCIKPVRNPQLDHARGDTPIGMGFWRRYAIDILPRISPPRRTLMFVPAARVVPTGETSLSQLESNGLGYTLARDLTIAAMGSNPWNQFRSVILFNGDNDGFSAENYRVTLSALFDRLKTDWSAFFSSSVPIILGLRRVIDLESLTLSVAFDISRNSVDYVSSGDLAIFSAFGGKNHMPAEALEIMGSRLATKSNSTYDRLNVAPVNRVRMLGQNGVNPPVPPAVPGLNAHRVMFANFKGLMDCGKIIDVSQFGDFRFKVRWADNAIMTGTGRPAYQIQNMYGLVSCCYIGDAVLLTLMRDIVQRGQYKIPYKRFVCFDEPPVFAGRYEFAIKTRSLDALHCALRTGPGFFDRGSGGVTSVRWRVENQFYPVDFAMSLQDAFAVAQYSSNKRAEDSAVASFDQWQKSKCVFTHRWSYDDNLAYISGFSKENNEPITGSWDMDGLDLTSRFPVRPIMFAECSSVLNVYANRRVTETY